MFLQELPKSKIIKNDTYARGLLMNIVSIGSEFSQDIVSKLSLYIKISSHLNFGHNVNDNHDFLCNLQENNRYVFIIDVFYHIFSSICDTELISSADKEKFNIYSGFDCNKIYLRIKELLNSIVTNNAESVIIFVFPSYINFFNMKIQEYSFDLYVENKRMQKKIEIDLIKDFSSCKNIIFIPSFFLKENAIAEKSPFISEQMLCAYAGIISQKLKKYWEF